MAVSERLPLSAWRAWWAGRVVQRWFGNRLSVGLLGSQTALMGIVLVSRLLPFISFDIVSYAAGLTALSTKPFRWVAHRR